MKYHLTIILLVLAFLTTKAQINLDYLATHMDNIINEGLDSAAYPGAQVLVAYQGKVIFHKTYGFHTFEKERRVQKDDLYDMASVTKVATGLPILMKLYGEGKFDIDAPLSQYLPKFKNSNKGDLTYREMLAHQAGLTPYIVYWQQTIKKNGAYKARTFKPVAHKNYPIKITEALYLHKNYKRKMYKAIKKSEVSEEKTYRYSGLLFLLLPEIIENITGEDFETYLKKQVYEPIGASTLTYNPLNTYPIERIIPTELDTFFRNRQVQGTVHDEAAAMLDGVSCNAGLFGTAEDLAKLFQLYLNKGTYNGKEIIQPAAVEEFTKYQYTENGNRRGLGFDKPLLEYQANSSYVAKSASPQSYGHSGFTGTFVWADPQHEVVVVFLSNRVYPTRANRKLYTLNIRPRLHQVVYDAIGQE